MVELTPKNLITIKIISEIEQPNFFVSFCFVCKNLAIKNQPKKLLRCDSLIYLFAFQFNWNSIRQSDDEVNVTWKLWVKNVHMHERKIYPPFVEFSLLLAYCLPNISLDDIRNIIRAMNIQYIVELKVQLLGWFRCFKC